MKFKAINTLSIKELFISQIEEMILSGELKPGDKLPTERELADEMNISKTIVHDGIRELARIGFLDVISRKGIYVAVIWKHFLPSSAIAVIHWIRK